MGTPAEQEKKAEKIKTLQSFEKALGLETSPRIATNTTVRIFLSTVPYLALSTAIISRGHL